MGAMNLNHQDTQPRTVPCADAVIWPQEAAERNARAAQPVDKAGLTGLIQPADGQPDFPLPFFHI